MQVLAARGPPAVGGDGCEADGGGASRAALEAEELEAGTAFWGLRGAWLGAVCTVACYLAPCHAGTCVCGPLCGFECCAPEEPPAGGLAPRPPPAGAAASSVSSSSVAGHGAGPARRAHCKAVGCP